MGSYLDNTQSEQLEMLHEAGYESFDDLYVDVPSAVKLDELNISEGMSELEAYSKMESFAKMNKQYSSIFRGAGAYDHYIPAIVDSVCNKEEFVTAYTPYQAEISQGILQSIFEYQTMICELTGMDVSNASVYDGATACSEAIMMCKERKRNIAYVSSTVDPKIIEVIKTYCFGNGIEVRLVDQKDGVTDVDALKAAVSDETACLLIQHPNYYGIFEPVDEMSEIVHNVKAKLIMSCNPIALAVMKTPHEYHADIAVGDGQPLGLGLAFGGPYLGFMATTNKMMRKLCGRIVGQTVDDKGQRAYVLTLQAREQHIRREKALSNICSNQALCALKVGVYLSSVGPEGLVELANICHSKAVYLKNKLANIGIQTKYDQPFFHEFVTVCKGRSNEIIDALDKADILGGLVLNDDEILWCTTEKCTKEKIDQVVHIIEEVCA